MQVNEHDWLEGYGRLVYDPYRGNMKKDTKWWCVVEVDREITRYYRWWLKREKHIILEQPAWDAHVSVIRGERAVQRNQSLWKKYHGERVKFRYQHGNVCKSKDVDQPGHFFWIYVDCKRVDEIRQELGLPTSFKYHHLTVGRTYY